MSFYIARIFAIKIFFFRKRKTTPYNKTFTQRNCFSSVRANLWNNGNKIQKAIKKKRKKKFAVLTFSTIIELMENIHLSPKCHSRHDEDDGHLINTVNIEKLVIL